MTLHDLELGVFNDALHRDAAALAADLREILGAPLVAYIGGVREARAVRQWADGTRQPQPAAVERLRLAYRVARLVEAREGRPVTQAWFQGLNPQLGDVSPARVLREGLPYEIGAQVLAAARTFVGAA